MKRDSALFLSVACVAVAVWTSSVTLSQHLAHVEQPSKPVERSVDQFTDLRNAAAARPDDLEARRNLADALAREGVSSGNSSILAEGLESYLRILQKEPENEGALLGIARLAFQAGVLDKAAEYYSKYLQLVPDDVKAKTDLALVYVQSDRAELGIPLLEEIKRDAPTLFPAALSLALAYRSAGDEERAKLEANRARTLAPDDEARAVVDRFITNPSIGDKGDAPSSDEVAQVSPAVAINQFFREHPILKDKVRNIRWPTATRVVVEVADFPVEQMPPFAKAKFETRVRALQQQLGDPVAIDIVESGSNRPLLEFDAPTSTPKP